MAPGGVAIDVRHQAGERWIDTARQTYASAGVRAERWCPGRILPPGR